MNAKGIALLLLGLMAATSRGALSQNTGVSIVSYQINAVVHPYANAVEVTATCVVEKTGASPEIQLLLSSNSTVDSVQVFANGIWSEMPFKFMGKDTIQMRFPATLPPTGAAALKFKYKFPIGPLGDSLLLLDKGNRWYPLVSDQVATLKLTCEVPDGYTVLSAGDLLETKKSGGHTQFVWKTNLPVFKVPLVVFRSASRHEDSTFVQNKKVVLYCPPTDSSAAAAILAEAKSIFSFFTGEVGEYPHGRLTLIVVPYFPGIDISSGLLMVGPPSLKGMEAGNFDALRLSIAEQWMGAGVFAKFRQPGFWFLTISLPHYLRLMYVRHSRGEQAFQSELNEPLKKYAEFAGKARDIAILDVDVPNTREKGLILYGKGPLVIHKLRGKMGDERWKVLLQDLYREFRGKILTYDEFRHYLSRGDKDGSSLTLLDRLMTQTGIPED